jgi:hypothetical protein
MRSMGIIGATALVAAALAACSTAPRPTARPTRAAAGPIAAAATPSATSPTPTVAPSLPPSLPAGANNVDPCQLVTQQEASALTGASFGKGTEETESGNGKRCIYGAQTKNVFEVIVAEAATTAEAQQVKNELLAEAQQKLGAALNLHAISGLADSAEQISGTLNGLVNLDGIYVLKGTFGFALVDIVVGHAAPSGSAMQAQAQTVVGRLP